MNFSYTLIGDWLSSEKGFRGELGGLLPHQKLLLLSDGSLTLELELLWRSVVEVEVKFKGTTTLSKEAAEYLEEAPDKEAMEREVWLTIEGKRLVYAHSIIPLNCIEKGLKDALEAHSDEPLGRVLNTKKVFFSKKKLEVGKVVCRSAAADLGIEEDSPLIARRYMLYNDEGPGKWIIKAAVTEVFSPEIISTKFFKKR
ncbi:MAG: chorismate lyase [Deltaproteobacteria bacterium]|nr:chorismate lyase [Deltaproteobacteria bacterium]